MANEQKPVFLSHSYHDKDLAEKLINLLTNGCDVSRNDILCTSLSGMNIKVGTTSFIDYLKAQLDSPKLVILLITENYLASSFCLAELGATWRMGIPYFPLAVPPIARSEIGGVLEVTQAGDVTSGAYLDQLRDKTHELFGKKMPTDGWNVQRDVFLDELDALIKGIKKPDLVQRAEFDKVQGQYKYAVDTIKAKDAEIGKLVKLIDELKALKDKPAVAAVVRKYSSTEQEFKQLCDAASTALDKLKLATVAALFWEMRGDSYCPRTEDDWNDVRDAEAVKEVFLPNADACRPNTELLIVQKAVSAVRELKNFLKKSNDGEFFARYEEENEFPPDVGHQKFWAKELRYF